MIPCCIADIAAAVVGETDHRIHRRAGYIGIDIVGRHGPPVLVRIGQVQYGSPVRIVIQIDIAAADHFQVTAVNGFRGNILRKGDQYIVDGPVG